MRKAVPEFIAARNNLFRFFSCSEQFPVRTMTNAEWAVHEDSGICFLTIFEGDSREDYVVSQKNDAPMVFNTSGYTMVVAIDCVKTAFVMKNDNAR